MQLSDTIKSRVSTKKFYGKNANWKKIIRAIDLAKYTPMAGNMFSLKVVIVQDSDTMKEIVGATQQDFLSGASAFLLIVSDRKKVEKMYDYNKKGFAQQQAGAFIQNLLLALTEQKIDNCWIGMFDDRIVKRATNISDDVDVEAIIAVGKASTIKQSKREKPDLETIVYFEKWGEKMMAPESRVRGEWS